MSNKKLTAPVLRNMIDWYFAKQGKKMANISKANKPKLLQIIEKYNIDKDEYWEVRTQEEKKEKEKEEEEEKKAKEEKEAEDQFDNKCRVISNLLCKKWYNSFHKLPHKKVIHKLYELNYNKQLSEYEYSQMSLSYSVSIATMNKLDDLETKYDLDVVGSGCVVRCKSGLNIVSNSSHIMLMHKPVKRFCWLDRQFMKRFYKH